jgi:hypothetical protein
MWQNLIIIAVLSISVGTCATTTAKGFPFRRLRKWLYFNKHDHVAEWGYGLIRCPFCSAHWYSLVAVGVFRPFISDILFPVDFLLVWLAVTGLASLFGVLICRAYNFLPDPWEEIKREEDMSEVEWLGEQLIEEKKRNAQLHASNNALYDKYIKEHEQRVYSEAREWM